MHSVSAAKKLCLTYGQSVPSAENPRYTCHSERCEVCVNDQNFPTNPALCKGGCEGTGSGGGIDTTPPVLDILSPDNGEVFSTSRILFDIRSNEPASLSYLDNIFGRNKWKRLSGLTRSYTQSLRFKDGEQDITIRGTDKKGNSIEVVRTFFVDSKKPKITKTLPVKGFANEIFTVLFKEENPRALVIHYGASTVHEKVLDLQQCTLDARGGVCFTRVSLAAFDGQTIRYWFELTDVAGNTVASKPLTVAVDGTKPLINNQNFWELHENKHLVLDMSISEANFDGVYYSDSEDARPQEKKICSKLDLNGKCKAQISFKSGHHEVTLTVKDKAGNVLIVPAISFDLL